MKHFILMFIIPLMSLLLMVGCGSNAARDTPVVTTHAPVDINAVLIVPDRVLDGCDPLAVPAAGSAGAVMDTMISNHGIHGACMFKNDLKADYLRAADETGAKVRLYAATPAHNSSGSNSQSR